MLRKIGKRISSHGSSIWDDSANEDDDDDTSAKYRRASEPVGLLSPARASSSANKRILSRHASVPEEELNTTSSKPHAHPQIRERDVASTLVLQNDILGLSLVHAYPQPLVDIIFIHGLGGASQRTWSWQRNIQNFWPPWLAQEAELARSRIFTFGYNADFSKEDTQLNILDFAMQLLFWMKTYSNSRSVNDEPIGTYPIIFVMHSMGGLIGKKAYIIGKADETYAEIISQVRAMLFLATPHRGSAHAEFLSSILHTTPGLSTKTYLSELIPGASTSLQDINQQFSTICGDLKLVSLYENYKTFIGLGKVGVSKMIVDKDSAVLGYPAEMRNGLNADHHGICKFRDINDPNYMQVRDILRLFVRTFTTNDDSDLPKSWNIDNKTVSSANKRALEGLLAVQADIDDDFESISDRIMDGTCQWIREHRVYSQFRDVSEGGMQLFWLTGLPATGKSVLSSSVINSLQQNPSLGSCAYYFFKSEHQTKRTIGHMLRCIAFQVAMSNLQFRTKLLQLSESGEMSFGQSKVVDIWGQIFEGILFQQSLDKPLFWVIDGLDEADHPEVLIKLLSRLQTPSCIRILIVSRYMKDLITTLGTKTELLHYDITSDDTLSDIKSYAQSIISTTLHADIDHEEICSKVLRKARGSFLWVALALEQLKLNWHTEADIAQVLSDLPEGMEALYVRMMHMISRQAPRPKTIAFRLLTWAVCAFRPLELSELAAALAPEFGKLGNLRDTIHEVCGNFVVVRKTRVALIHDTALQFLLHKASNVPGTLDHRAGNEHIASTCLHLLMDSQKNWKRMLSQEDGVSSSSAKGPIDRPFTVFDEYPFFSYAVTWWAYHVSLSPPRTSLIATIFEFFESSCLEWMHAVALLGDMRVMTRTAQYLKVYLKRRKRKSSNESLISLTGDRDDELKQWTKDLIRVVGRFGNTLVVHPQAIYTHVIPFCPTGSIIRQTYEKPGALSITGLSGDSWDDCLARLSMGSDEYVFKVICKGAYFLTLISNGVLIIWHAESCAEAGRIEHGEWVSVVESSKVSPWIATAGTKTIRVWDVSTGFEVFSLPKQHERRILALSFGANDSELLIGYDDSTIQCVDLMESTTKWNVVLEEPGDTEHLCAHLISFSPDNFQVLVGFRGRPMLAWTLGSRAPKPQKLLRPEDRFGRHHDTWKAGTPETVVWRPDLAIVLVIYNDNTLFEWDIEENVPKEVKGIGLRDMVISHDGNLLMTADHNGTMSVWTVPEYRLAYQLHGNDMVRSLAFSPDGQRIYDIRGSFCNVWEPDALIRLDDLEREELSSMHDTNITEPTSAVDDIGRAQITALVLDAEDNFYCCGKDSGAVVLYDIKSGEKMRKAYGHSSVASVIELAWSKSCKFIASADDCGRIIAKRLRKPNAQSKSWAVYPLLDFRLGEAVSQLLFSTSEEFLLVSSSTCDYIWSLKEKKEICRAENASKKGTKWMNHPLLEDRLISIDHEDVQTFSWKGLKLVRKTGLIDIDATVAEGGLIASDQNLPDMRRLRLQKTNSAEDHLLVERVVHVRSSQIVFEATPSRGSKNTHINHRKVTQLDIMTSETDVLQQAPITGLSGEASRLIGSLQGQLVFLDSQHAFWTWDMSPGGGGFERHFFLPKDWVSPSIIKLCAMNNFGTILCPKNGEVAVIRGGFKL